MDYLKGLGVLRLFALQKDQLTRAAWEGEALVLVTVFDRSEVERFFLDEYVPTPLLAPWNKGSGFWEANAHRKAVAALRALRESDSTRLEPYRRVLRELDVLLPRLGWTGMKAVESKKDEDKRDLIRALRNRLPDGAVPWIDATAVLTLEKATFAPLLGTGANDGRLDFTPNFVAHLASVIPFRTSGNEPAPSGRRGSRSSSGFSREASLAWLRQSLFREGNPQLVDATGGQYHPGATGGPNASSEGFEGEALLNPWDFVLLLEGTLVLAAAVSRRMGSEGGAGTARLAAFPFTASTSAAGSGTMSASDRDTARAEIWMPLWDNEATFGEVERLFAEGRVQVGRRQATSGVEFAVAAASLGVDRGIRAFQRFGLLQRNGRAYLATPLTRVSVRERSGARLVEQVQPWIDVLRLRAADHATIRSALHALDRAIFAHAQDGSTARLRRVVACLGRLERLISERPSVHEFVRPLELRAEWLDASDDGSDEHTLAASLATMTWRGGKALREWLEPVARKRDRLAWSTENDAIWSRRGLLANLHVLLMSSLQEHEEEETAEAGEEERRTTRATVRRAAPPRSVAAFLRGAVDDVDLEDTLWGLACLRAPAALGEDRRHRQWPARADDDRDHHLPTEYVLLKTIFLERALRVTKDAEPVLPGADRTVLVRLWAGDLRGAIERAVRRLAVSGLVPKGSRRIAAGRYAGDFSFSAPRRLAAALAFPLDPGHISRADCFEVPRDACQAPVAPVEETDTQREGAG